MTIFRYIKILRTYWPNEGRNTHIIFLNFLLMLIRLPFSLIDLILIKLGSQSDVEPIFVLGYYRSGTTHLQKLISLHPSVSYLNIFKTYFPDSFLSMEFWFKPLTQMILTIFKIKNPIHRVPFNWDLPGEEDIAFAFHPSRFSLNWSHAFPSKAEEVYERAIKSDREEFKDYYLSYFKRITFLSKKRYMVLKSPPNTARVETLLELFPNAKFVYIQRDPLETLASNRYLLDVVDGAQFEKISSDERDELIIDLYLKMTDDYFQQRELIPKENLYETTFEKLVKNPQNELLALFKQFSLAADNDSLVEVNRFIRAKHGKHMGNYSDIVCDSSTLARLKEVKTL